MLQKGKLFIVYILWCPHMGGLSECGDTTKWLVWSTQYKKNKNKNKKIAGDEEEGDGSSMAVDDIEI